MISLDTIPDITPVPEGTPITLSFSALNFPADWRAIEEAPGKVVYTNIQAPIDQPCTLRIAQVARPNVYSGTGIEPSAQCATKRGCDTVVELKMVWKLTDSGDPTFVQYLPVRVALTMNLPVNSSITADNVLADAILPLLGGIASSATDMGLQPGLTELLHGVVEKR